MALFLMQENFLDNISQETSPPHPDRLWGPSSLLSILGAKRLGREAKHSSQSSSEVDNAWSYTSTPQYVFM